MLTLVLVVAAMAALAFFCSTLEAALRALPMSKLEELLPEDPNTKSGGLRRRSELPISALIALSTGITTAGSVLVGALAVGHFNADETLVVAAAVGASVVALLAAQGVGHALGSARAEGVVSRSRWLVSLLSAALSPFAHYGDRLVGRRAPDAPQAKVLSQSEIIALAKIAADEGAITADEARLVENALRLSHKNARQIMTPRTVVYRLPDELPLTMVTAHSDHWTHSRLPLCKDNDPDRVVGLVFRREVFDTLLNKSDEEIERMKLSDLARPVEFIPENLRGDEILQRFLKGRNHLFIVTNEHGGMEGIITLEDVLEELLGADIVDYHDQHVDMQEYARLLAGKKRANSAQTSDSQQFID